MSKRLAYVDVTPAEMADFLGLPEGSEVVGVGWEAERLLIQVRSDEVPVRKPADAGEDVDADHKAEHVRLKQGASGVSFEKVED